MARGIGKLQQLILDTLRRLAKPVPLATLIWEVAHAEDVLDPASGDIPEQIYKNVHEAARSLLNPRRALVTERKARFRSLDELIRVYPDRTRSARIRSMRRRLLKYIPLYIEKKGPKRSIADIEMAVFVREFEWEKHRTEATRSWQRIERSLLRVIPSMEEVSMRRSLEFIVRANEMLKLSRVAADVSVINVARDVREAVANQPHLAKSIRTFLMLLPVNRIKRALFKNELYAVVSLEKSAHLLEPFKLFLLQHEEEFVSTLPGHRLAPTPSLDDGLIGFGRRRRPVGVTFSGELDELLGRDVLGPVPVYQLAALASEAKAKLKGGT